MCLTKTVRWCFTVGVLVSAFLLPADFAFAKAQSAEKIVSVHKTDDHAFFDPRDFCKLFKQGFDDPLNGKTFNRPVELVGCLEKSLNV